MTKINNEKKIVQSAPGAVSVMASARQIAINSERNPNMGRVVQASLGVYDNLIKQPWLAKMIDEIRGGNDELKKELPIRMAHYFHCVGDHRDQKHLDPEAFLFQTTVDIDDINACEAAQQKALLLNKDEKSAWFGKVRRIEKSARGKLHIDIEMPVGMTIAETQQAFCNAINVPYDESCVSPERIIFITDACQEIYRSDSWNKVMDGEELEAHRQAFIQRGLTIDGREADRNVPEKTSQAEKGAEKGAEKAEKVSYIAFDLCVKKAGLDASAMDIWGVHNWHSNLLAVLSVGVAKLMSREQLMAVIADRLPNYAKYADCKQLVDSFYDNYASDKKPMSAELRELNAKAQAAAMPSKEIVNVDMSGDDDADIANYTDGYNPPEFTEKLPEVLELLCSNFESRFRTLVAISSIPGLAGIASHYRARYINGKVIGPQDYVAVIAGSGKGKGYAYDVHNMIVGPTLRESDRNEIAKLQANIEERDKKANAKEKPAAYKPKLHTFETVSSSSLLALQQNLGENDMLVGCFPEADAFMKGSGAAQQLVSSLLRKGWSGETHSQYYKSENSPCGIFRMCISVLITGTVQTVVGCVLGGKNAENGLMQRFIPVMVKPKKRSFLPPVSELMSDDDRAKFNELIMQLYQKNLALGDDVEILDMPGVTKVIYKWAKELQYKYDNGEMTDAEADLFARIGEHMMRAAIALVALYGHETKEIINYVKKLGEIAYYNICWLFGHRVQEDLNEARELVSGHRDKRRTASNILDEMKDVFTKKEMMAARKASNQTPECKMFLTRAIKDGKIRKIGRNVYQKVKGVA